LNLRDQIRIFGKKFACRLRGKAYDSKRDLVNFQKRGFQGVIIGLLEPSHCEIEDILRCCYVTSKNLNNNRVAPTLYWLERGYLICLCRETFMFDSYGLTIAFPFVCFSEMPKFEPELKVPNIKPEQKIPVLKINQPALRDSLDSLLEGYEKWKWKGERGDVS